MQPSGKHVRRLLIALDGAWGRLAASYRRQLWLERRPIQTLLTMLRPTPGERLLDVATGTAELLAELARTTAPPRHAIGVDSAAETLALAPPLPQSWELLRADAARLPFTDHSFDLVTASYLLHFLEAEQRAPIIAEMARVLRPGGRLGVITIAPPASPITSLLAAPAVSLAQRSRGRFAALRPLDPAAELRAQGFRELARRRCLRGYPSLCLVVARPPQGCER